MKSRAVVLVVTALVVFGGGVWSGAWWTRVPATDPNTSAALVAKRRELDSLALHLGSVQTQLDYSRRLLDLREDSLAGAYQRDTLWRTKTKVVVESLPGQLDRWRDSVGVPFDSVKKWVAAALADANACSAAIQTCNERATNAERRQQVADSSRQVADSLVGVAKSRQTTADSLLLERTKGQRKAEQDAKRTKVGAVLAVLLALLAR